MVGLSMTSTAGHWTPRRVGDVLRISRFLDLSGANRLMPLADYKDFAPTEPAIRSRIVIVLEGFLGWYRFFADSTRE